MSDMNNQNKLKEVLFYLLGTLLLVYTKAVDSKRALICYSNTGYPLLFTSERRQTRLKLRAK